jgi:hypothetical protein
VRVRGEGGHLETLQWARENGCPWNEWTCSFAAEGGHLEVAEVGARERLPVGRGDVRVRGVGGHLEVLKWARENGCPWDETTCACAAETATSRS